MLRVLLRGIKAGLRGFQTLPRGRHFTGRRGSRRGQLGQRVHIVLRLVARQSILLHLRGGCLLLGLGAVVHGWRPARPAPSSPRSRRSPPGRAPPRHPMSESACRCAPGRPPAHIRPSPWWQAGCRTGSSQRARRVPLVLTVFTASGAPPAPRAPATGRAESTAPRETRQSVRLPHRSKAIAARLRSCFSHAF